MVLHQGDMAKKKSSVNFADDVELGSPPSRLRSIGSALFDMARSNRPSYTELSAIESGGSGDSLEASHDVHLDDQSWGVPASRNNSFSSRPSFSLRRVSNSKGSHLDNLHLKDAQVRI